MSSYRESDHPREQTTKRFTNKPSDGMDDSDLAAPLDEDDIEAMLAGLKGVASVTRGENVMGGRLEAELSDGRAVEIDLHDNPAWRDGDKLHGRIEVIALNRPQAKWRWDESDMPVWPEAIVDPDSPTAGDEIRDAVGLWRDA